MEHQQNLSSTIANCIEERNTLLDDMQKPSAEREKKVVCAGTLTAMYVAVTNYWFCYSVYT